MGASSLSALRDYAGETFEISAFSANVLTRQPNDDFVRIECGPRPVDRLLLALRHKTL
jgi:hypothetical protein